MTRPLILLTNDDGISSPGLAAAAAALIPLGELIIAAPTEQQSGMGRSMPGYYDGRIYETPVRYDGSTFDAFGVNASPAQAVRHALLELTPRKPDMVVSGINYGENLSTGISISGTVGAALEAAAAQIPAMAISFEVDPIHHTSNDASVDFSTAAYFTGVFVKQWLTAPVFPDVDVLKIDIPASATRETGWRMCYLEKREYYRALKPNRRKLDETGRLGYAMNIPSPPDSGSDVGTMHEGVIAIVPLSLDFTSRIDLDVITDYLSDEE